MLKLSSLAKIETFEQNKDILQALESSTHMGIGAHQDDLEVMAAHGILECFNDSENSFVGVVCTNGKGSARTGKFAQYTDEQMQEVRSKEQSNAAQKAQFAAMLQLAYESSLIKGHYNEELLRDLESVIDKSQPQVIYTHNLADKHQTHVGVSAHVIQCLRRLNYKPQRFLGCEVWRGLDWLTDQSKVPLSISKPNLVSEWIACHESQVQGGKRYDKAALGRMLANATFFDSHNVDEADHLWLAMDLIPLLDDKKMKLTDFMNSYLEKLQNEMEENLKNFDQGAL